jgi:glycosyltransferase involved in cell wall biosynthesis
MAINHHVTIIIPIFNDFDSIFEIVKQIDSSEAEFKQRGIKFLIIDNGSTRDVISSRCNREDLVEVHRLATNQGFGGAIIEGARHSKTAWVGWMPGNLKVSPSSLLQLCDEIRLEPRLIIKCRRIRKNRLASLKTLVFGVMQTLIARSNMLDSGGTPTLCERKFLLNLPQPPRSIVFESYVLYCARKQKMIVIRPLNFYGERRFGESHWQKGFASELDLAKETIRAILRWNKESEDAA